MTAPKVDTVPALTDADVNNVDTEVTKFLALNPHCDPIYAYGLARACFAAGAASTAGVPSLAGVLECVDMARKIFSEAPGLPLYTCTRSELEDWTDALCGISKNLELARLPDAATPAGNDQSTDAGAASPAQQRNEHDDDGTSADRGQQSMRGVSVERPGQAAGVSGDGEAGVIHGSDDSRRTVRDRERGRGFPLLIDNETLRAKILADPDDEPSAGNWPDPPQAASPVAWRWRARGAKLGGWRFDDGPTWQPTDSDNGLIWEPLYTSAPAPPVAWHTALRSLAIKDHSNERLITCRLCGWHWTRDRTESHAPHCLADPAAAPVQRDAVGAEKWLNLLRGYRKMVNAVAPHFDKPITDENVVLWLNLNNAGATIDAAIAARAATGEEA